MVSRFQARVPVTWVQMMAERGILLAHMTIMRWVQRYVPDFEKGRQAYAQPVGDSWRAEETYIKVRGQWVRFSLSYRDVEELLAERGLHGDHVTVWRWVQRYAPEMERRLHSRLKPTSDSWRVDETYIRVKGKWRYL